MAIIQCPVCEGKISSFARICPLCKKQLKNDNDSSDFVPPHLPINNVSNQGTTINESSKGTTNSSTLEDCKINIPPKKEITESTPKNEKLNIPKEQEQTKEMDCSKPNTTEKSHKWLIASTIIVLFLSLCSGTYFLFFTDENPTPAPPPYIVDGKVAIDLGLSVNWANTNIGASSESDYGDYYSWAEVDLKKNYVSSTSSYYHIEMNDISGIEYHDAATKEWANNWRIPTKKEFDELKDLCSWTLTNKNETWGYTVTGPNGNNIFIPLAGCKGDTRKYFCNEVGAYWSSTPYTDSKGS